MSEEIENDLKIKKIANETFERLFKLLSEKDKEIERLKKENNFLKQLIPNEKKYSYGIRMGSAKE